MGASPALPPPPPPNLKVEKEEAATASSKAVVAAAAAHRPISTAHEVRGIYAHEDEAFEYLRKGWPKFETKAECMAFVRSHCRANPGSNPERPHMTQMITTLVNWEQVEKYLLGARREYDERWPARPAAAKIPDSLSENLWVSEDDAAASLVDGEIRKRLELPMHRRLTPFSVESTLRYLFEHMRCGIYVMLRRNKVAMFVPFVNENFQNNWGDRLRVEDDLETRTYYERKRSEVGGRVEHALASRSSWWANGNIMCNEHSSKGEPAEKSQLWGDRFVASLRDVLDAACSERVLPDCEFFVNKRDYPQLKYHVFEDQQQEPQPVEPYGFLVDADDRDPEADATLPRPHRSTSLAPVVSFYCSDRFSDIPWPPSEDWEAAIGTIMPPSFDHEIRDDGEIELDAEPRDLFTDAKFRQFDCAWDDKVETAFFRGTATGGGVTVLDNQRLAIASLSHEWKTAAARANGPAGLRERRAARAGREKLLDAALTGWNRRDKKLGAKPMTYIRPHDFLFEAGRDNFVPIFQQSRYKYLIYVEGHCAACRYGFMMRLGSVILKVESRCVADKIWFFPLLRPFVDHIPVRADLSDLADKIRWCRANDAKCQKIARNAKTLWDTYVSKRGLLDYVQLVVSRVAERFEYPRAPWLFDDDARTTAFEPLLPPKLANRDPASPCRDEGLCDRCADDLLREREAAEKENQRAAARLRRRDQRAPERPDLKRKAAAAGADHPEDSAGAATTDDAALRQRMMKARRNK
ncbi:hypothetical protein CTAYLR_005230 [Chrysophaeum taylorii]|uniref:Glycosyl transferase CAP10 domain-containing protein n=1 Tax=Chrysophaeum taylorii TaxID=2483200 RepID=A0AAD7UB63_9STRA|nr:hypothetical protein CTAYLR_005230 [Chrysophaeum taylorii]